MNINAGTLSLGVGSDSVDSNAGAVTLANGTTFAIGVGGFGTHVFAGAISDGANSATVTNASGNQVTFSGDFSVQTLTNTGNLDLNGANTSPAVVNLNGGNLGGTDSYSISQAFNWSAGTLGGSGTTTIPAAGTIDFQSAAAKIADADAEQRRHAPAVVLDVAGLR